LSRGHLIALLFDLYAALDGSSQYSAHLLILVLPYSYLLPIKPDQERQNNWTNRDDEAIERTYRGIPKYRLKLRSICHPDWKSIWVPQFLRSVFSVLTRGVEMVA